MPHHWSGWPGAYCLHCGSEDPVEISLADNTYDIDNPPDIVIPPCPGGNFAGECGQCGAQKEKQI